MRSILITVLTLAALGLAGCGHAASTASTASITRSSTPSTTNPASASTTPAGEPTSTPALTGQTQTGPGPSLSTTNVVPTARQAAAAFAVVYARYLDGLASAEALPDASAQVRRQAGQLMPVVARRGRLTVKSVVAVANGSTLIAQLADQAHSFQVQLTVAPVSGRQKVVALVPPDFDSLLAPPPRPIPAPLGSAPPQHAAREFLTGYLAWQYGHGRISTIHAATRSLLTQLNANPPNVPPAFRSRHARVVALGLRAAPGGTWTVFVNLTDGEETYELTVTVVRKHGRWLVTSVNFAQ